MAKLTFVLEDDQEVVVPLTERITVGRAEDNDVVVDDDRVSKHHAEILPLAGDRYEVIDLGSVAGTFVNEERVKTRVLRTGDHLAFGPLQGRFELEDEEPAPAATRPVASTVTAPVALKTAKVPVQTTKVPVPEEEKTAPPLIQTQAEAPKAPPAPEPKGDKEQPPAPMPASAADEPALREAIGKLEKEKARLEQETTAAEASLEEWRMKASKERNAHENRLSTLRSAEERLLPLQAAAKHAETTHGEWLAAIQVLAVEHEEKSAALIKATQDHDQKMANAKELTAKADAARQELEALALQHSQEAARLKQTQQDSSQEETRLQQLRQDCTQEAARLARLKEQAETEQQQARDQNEAQLRLLNEQNTLKLQQEREASETRLTELRRQQAECESNAQKARAAAETQEKEAVAVAEKIAQLRQEQMQAEESASRAQANLTAWEADASSASQKLDEITLALSQATTRLAEVEAQHASLALTDHQISQLNSGLASLVQQHAAADQRLSTTQAQLAEAESSLAAQTATLQSLEAEEAAAKGRLSTISGQKEDLEAEVATLSATIKEHRSTLEQIQRHAAEHEEAKRALEATRNELQDLTSRLTPLRDWKEAMDQLYARFAALPQGTPESQDLWREIETGKAMLIRHIMSLHTRVPRIVHIEFSRQGVKPGTPMKSERVRSKGKT